MLQRHRSLSFFFFNDTATTEIYTLSLHDALPIFENIDLAFVPGRHEFERDTRTTAGEHVDDAHRFRELYLRMRASPTRDRKSTRLNSSHSQISYAVFCLKKKT